MQERITIRIKDSKDVLLVADALLKSGYTVATPKRKVGGKWEQFIVAAIKSEGETEEPK